MIFWHLEISSVHSEIAYYAGKGRNRAYFFRTISIPDCLQKPYMKLKVQELLLFLYTVDAAKEKQRERYTSPHVENCERDT